MTYDKHKWYMIGQDFGIIPMPYDKNKWYMIGLDYSTIILLHKTNGCDKAFIFLLVHGFGITTKVFTNSICHVILRLGLVTKNNCLKKKALLHRMIILT
jgi:hypothetical protein